MVTKTSGKKTVRRSGKNYQVTAIYGAVFKTAQAAKDTADKIKKASKFARVSPIKKTAKGYVLSVRFVMVTDKAEIKNKAVVGAKAQGARVSVKMI